VVDDDPELGWGPFVGGGVRRESMDCAHREMLTPEFAPPLAVLLAKHLVPH
jgi:hypothetical protein